MSGFLAACPRTTQPPPMRSENVSDFSDFFLLFFFIRRIADDECSSRTRKWPPKRTVYYIIHSFSCGFFPFFFFFSYREVKNQQYLFGNGPTDPLRNVPANCRPNYCRALGRWFPLYFIKIVLLLLLLLLLYAAGVITLEPRRICLSTAP